MTFEWTDDPVMDQIRYQGMLEEEASHWPHCEHCEEPIYDYVWNVWDTFYCEDCAKKLFREPAERYVRE
jgi:hypothetical protein